MFSDLIIYWYMQPIYGASNRKNENFKKGYDIFIRRCNTANQVIWNWRFENQGANNIVNLWLPDAMIQWSFTESDSNTS